ncbi:MAG: aquaporin [Oscillospiraceae bacterium]|nr:aquaporin [Oscillospiraceae bacterium]
MTYLSEFIGSFIFLAGGYAYMCNVNLKKTLVSTLNYIELVVAWSLAVGFGLAIAAIMGGPAYLNPGVVIGSVIWNGLAIGDALMYILMEFLAAGAAVLVCMVFFYDSFKATEGTSKRGICKVTSKVQKSGNTRKKWKKRLKHVQIRGFSRYFLQ